PAVASALQEGERLLVLAALGPRDQALAAWTSWLAARSLDDIEPGSFAILPAVSKQMERDPGDHPEAGRLRGVYRYAWAQNQVTFRDLTTAVRALTEAGVPVVAHRGLPIVARYLGDPAAIIVDQVDLLIPPADLSRAVAALASRGWHPPRLIPSTRVRSAFESIALWAPDRRRVVLHWRCLPLGCPARLERGVIDRAVQWELQGLRLFIPEPTDQALIASVASGTLQRQEIARWTLESLAISTAGIDAGDLARRREASGADRSGAPGIPTREALDHARSDVGPPAQAGRAEPDPGQQLPAASPVTRLLRALPRTWQRYQAVCRANAHRATPWGFARFIPAYYHHAWQVSDEVGLTRSAIRQVLSGPGHPGVRPT
ncbi:MAG: nucleotidyltransferase family protein, partial [Gemmatimonadales bacterium]